MSTASDKCQDSLVNRNSNGIFSCTAAILVLFISSLLGCFIEKKRIPMAIENCMLEAGR